MGTTPTERYLQGLARRSFLSLWSHGNPHTPEGRRGNKGAGKELCDLLVIFGENILMFSDKDIQFQRDIDIGIAWGRWYRRAVEKSADQLAGALKWLNRFPQEVYLDALCTSRLPTSIPDISRCKIHLICIANGAYNSCRAFFGNSGIGSLVVDLTLKGHQQHTQPFHVGAMSGRTSGLFTFLMSLPLMLSLGSWIQRMTLYSILPRENNSFAQNYMQSWLPERSTSSQPICHQ